MQRVMPVCDLRRTCRPNPVLASLYLNTMYSVLRVVDNVSNFYCDATSAIAILSLTGVCSSIVNKYTWYCAKYNDLLIQYNTMHSRLQYYVGYLTVTMPISLSNFNSNHILWFLPSTLRHYDNTMTGILCWTVRLQKWKGIEWMTLTAFLTDSLIVDTGRQRLFEIFS